MKKKFNIGSNGLIEGLHVIGFHGEVDLAQTPARREPLFVDEEGRLVGLDSLEQNTTEAAPSVRAIWGRVGQRIEGPLPGIGTKLDELGAAYWTHIAVILGETELRHAKELAVASFGLGVPRVYEFLTWLGDPTASFATEVNRKRYGDGAVWYCSPEESFTLYRCISRIAEQRMLRASNEKDERALYQASWWLARAAIDDSDRYIAAVGLERSERRMADAYLKATFRKRSSAEIEAGLTHARGVFNDKCVFSKSEVGETHRILQNPPVGQIVENGGIPNIGKTLTRSRASVRKQFIVGRTAA